MAFSWIVSSAIEFSSNGVKIMEDLSVATKKLSADVKDLQVTVEAVCAAIDVLTDSAVRATDAVVDMSAAIGKSNTATSRAGTRATRAAAAYDAMAASAARAAAGVQAVTGASGSQFAIPRAAGGGGGAGGGFGLGSVMGMLPGPVGIAARVGSIANYLTGGSLGHLAEGAALIDAVHEAGKLQTLLLTAQNVTGANGAQMDQARQKVFNVADQTGMSADQSAAMFREIARMTVGSMSFKDMLELLPETAKMQVALGATRGFSPEQTIDNTLALVHLFRQYSPKGTPAMMDTILRMGELMPSNLSQAVTQMSYFLPTLKNLHVSNEDAASMMVAMSRFGGTRGRGGTSLQNLAANALGPLQLTQHAQAGKAGLLGPKMLDVLDAKGKSRYFTDKGGDMFGFLDKLAAFENKHGSVEAQRVFEGAFGKQGGKLADMFSDPVLIDQLHKIVAAIKDQNSKFGLKNQVQTISGTFDFQEKRAANDFQSLMTEIGSVAIPGVTKGLRDLGDSFHGAQVWLHAHKQLETEWAADITNTVQGVETYLVAHRQDFIAIGQDVGNFVGGINEIGKVAALAIGPLTTAARVIADIATLNVGDLAEIVSEGRLRNVTTQINELPSHDARTAAWMKYQQEFGSAGIPANIARALSHSHSKTNPHPGLSTTPMGKTYLTISVDARGSTDPHATHAAAQRGVTAAITAAKAKARTSGALFSSPNVAPMAGFGPAAVGAHG